jgi:GYF domain 2
MSADPRGAESIAGDRRWYLEVSGRRAGPFAWGVLAELAQAGALAAEDRVWCMGLASWSRAGDVADLARLIREPAQRRIGPGRGRLHPLPLAAAGAWIALTIAYYIEHFELWGNLLDGVLAARLNTAAPLVLLLLGLGVLPGLWRGTRPDALGRSGPARGSVRALAGVGALALTVTVISTLLNGGPFLLIALGSDPMGRTYIQLLPGGREIEIRGALAAGTAARLRQALAAHPQVRFVHLNSPGGWVTEGERLARVIHARRLGTYTATGCYSACVLAFVAGRPRVLNPDARLGLHSTSGVDADPLVATLGNKLYQRVLLRYGVSASLVAWSTSTPASEIWMPDPQQLLAGHLIDRISADGFSASGESLAAFASQASSFEARYPFLTELRRLEAARFERLDREVKLGLRRGAPRAELNGYVALAAVQVERERLAEADDPSVLRFALALRGAARDFHSSDPAQCAAILAPLAAAPARSAAALASIGPALAALLQAPHTSRIAAPPAGATTQGEAPAADPRMECDRLLLMYDTALGQTPGTGAALVRALQGAGAGP